MITHKVNDLPKGKSMIPLVLDDLTVTMVEKAVLDIVLQNLPQDREVALVTVDIVIKATQII